MSDVLIISGCNISLTPVVSSYLQYLKNNNVNYELVEYSGFRRIKFIYSSIKKMFSGEFHKIIFVNQQALPALLVANYLTKLNLVYWKLESYRLLENASLALNIQALEYLLIRKRISLVVPTQFRASIQKPAFTNVTVVPNAPLKPHQTQNSARHWDASKINLVIYGNLNKSNDVYLDEWITFAQSNNRYTLSIIGASSDSTEQVSFKGKYKHEALINELCDLKKFNFSIVGYKDTGQNTKFAAPNKLIESLACGIPVIGHIGNPYVVEIVKRYSCGLLFDFNDLKDISLSISSEKYFDMTVNAIKAADDLSLSNSINKSVLDINTR